MAQARYKFNQSSFTAGAPTPDEGSGVGFQFYASAVGVNSSPAPYEGSYCLRVSAGSGYAAGVQGTFTGWDMFVYLPTGFGDFTPVIGDASYYGTLLEWCAIKPNGSFTIEFYYNDYAGEEIYQLKASSAAGVVPLNQWFRLRVLCNPYSPTDVQVFTGNNILGTTPTAQISTSSWLGGSWGQYLQGSSAATGPSYIDDLYISNTISYPTRGEEASTARLSCGIITT
jgi:hypothetical protein